MTHDEAKARIAAKLAERHAARARQRVASTPRYDEVFVEGTKWLDSRIGEGEKDLG